MNIEIFWKSTNISSHVLAYKRDQTLCDGIGLLTFSLDGDSSYSIDPWDTVVLYENDIKKGTYFVVQSIKSAPNWEITVDCQDASKRLSDYFVGTSYFIDYPSYTRYWIELFLQQAGVSYTFNVTDDGNLLSNNTTLGMDFALGIITTLLKQSGWYIFFNADGIAVIGKADVRSSLSFDDTDIVEISLANDDKYLRNRAVVWGGEGYYPGTQIGVEVVTTTPWDIDANDKRSVLYTHSGVRNSSTAYRLALTLLNEFDTISSEKTVKLAGAHNLTLCDLVNISNRDVYNGNGIVTSIQSEMSSNGLFTTLILDEKCPRMFGFYVYGDQYVYAGTAGEGVYRKPLPSPVWEDYSPGLINRETIDLKVNRGLLAAVMNDGYGYKRTTSENAWTKFGHGNLIDRNGVTYTEGDTDVVACAINRSNNNIYFGVKATSDTVCWIVETDSNLTVIQSYQIIVNENTEITLFDIDTDDSACYATVEKDHYLWVGDTDYYCNYSFSTDDETTISRTWSSVQYYSITNPFLCLGKAYYVGQLSSDHTKCVVVIDDHTNEPTSTITRTTSASYTIAADRYLNNEIYFDIENEIVYFSVADIYDDDVVDVVSYDINSTIFTSVGTLDKYPLPGGKTPGGAEIINGKYILIPYTYYGPLSDEERTGCGNTVTVYYRDVTFGCMVHDITTCTTSYQTFVTLLKLGDSIIPDDTYSFLTNEWGAPSFDRINGYFTMVSKQTGSAPCDSLCDGGDSYEEDWIYKSYLIWFNFNCNTGTFVDYNSIILHPQPTLYSPDSAATVHSTVSTGFQRTGTGSYFGDGPYCFIGFKIIDDGPWKPYPITSSLCLPQTYHYELYGDRGVINPSVPYGYAGNEYARTYKVNLSNGDISLVANYSDIFSTGAGQIETYFTGGLAFDSALSSITLYSGNDGIETISSYDGNFLLDKTDLKDGAIFIVDVDIISISSEAILLKFISRDGSTLLHEVGVGGLNRLNFESLQYAGNGENLVYLQKIGSSLGSQYSTLSFIEFSSWNEIFAPAFLTTREYETEIDEIPVENEKRFIVIDQTTTPHQLEISHQGIISTFAYSGITNDVIRLGYSGGGFWTRIPEELPVAYSGIVSDIRVVRGLQESVDSGSGIMDLLVAYNSSLSYSPPASGASWTNLVVTTSGIVSCTETSNFQVPNSVFYNVYSGGTVSGSNTFFQRLPGQSTFSNMSLFIPTTKMKIIRIDDRI